MDFLEDYKELFDKVSQLEEDGQNVFFMKQEEALPNADKHPILNQLDGVDSSEPEVSSEFPSLGSKKASTVIAGTDKIKVKPIDDIPLIDDEKELDNEDMEMLKHIDDAAEEIEKAFEHNAESAMKQFNDNHKVVSHSEKKVDTSVVNSNGYGVSSSYKEVNGEPEFLKVRNIKPIDNTRNVDVKKSSTGKTFDKVKPDGKFDENADDVLKRYRDIVDGMRSMDKYDKYYKNKCAGILKKYSNLPKIQFESLCDFMSKVH